MPTITVDKAALFEALGGNWDTEKFDKLCFEYGIELDEDTTDQERPIVDGVQEPPQLKIEIPANRYDMLCFEGIAMNLNVFLGRQKFPNYRLVAPPGQVQTMIVHEPTTTIRPLVSCAILRNVKFDQARYDSFIALQDKLHANLARNRTLVSIGTHDLDTIKGPFHYKALPPKDIKFIPLNQKKEMNGEDLMAFYDKDRHLGRFLHIIRDSPLYPVIYDANDTVLSLPPIINGDHSKITLDTKNIFIEITALDKTKVEIVNQIMVTMFSMYCSEPFTVEPVKVVSDHNKETRETPDLTPRQALASVDYLNSCTGLRLTPEEQCNLLNRMGHKAVPSKGSPGQLDVSVPVTRSDILHEADIMEDLAVCYGFNDLPRFYPSTSAAVGAPLPINKLTDIVRLEAAMAGWVEVMPLILCSRDENFAYLNRRIDGNTAVELLNPKSQEYQIIRTSLLPGLLKSIRENKHRPVPFKIFEVSDVAFKAPKLERKSRNERHFAAAWFGRSSGFEVVHGLMDRVFSMLDLKFSFAEEPEKEAKPNTYWIEELDDPTYFAGHAASIHVITADPQGNANPVQVIGSFGVLHPSVLKNYELPYPVSTLEFNLEVFL